MKISAFKKSDIRPGEGLNSITSRMPDIFCQISDCIPNVRTIIQANTGWTDKYSIGYRILGLSMAGYGIWYLISDRIPDIRFVLDQNNSIFLRKKENMKKEICLETKFRYCIKIDQIRIRPSSKAGPPVLNFCLLIFTNSWQLDPSSVLSF